MHGGNAKKKKRFVSFRSPLPIPLLCASASFTCKKIIPLLLPRGKARPAKKAGLAWSSPKLKKGKKEEKIHFSLLFYYMYNTYNTYKNDHLLVYIYIREKKSQLEKRLSLLHQENRTFVKALPSSPHPPTTNPPPKKKKKKKKQFEKVTLPFVFAQ